MIPKDREKDLNLLWINHVYLDTDTFATTQLQIAKELIKLKTKFKFIVPWFSKTSENIDTFRIPIPRVPILASIVFNLLIFLLYPLIALFRKSKVVVIDYNSVPGIWLWIIISRIFGKTKFILDIRSPPVSVGNSIYDALLNIQFKIGVYLAKLVVNRYTFLTETMAKDIIKQFKIKTSEYFVWTSGVNTRIFRNSKELQKKGRKLRIQNNLSTKFIIIYHGILTGDRGLQEVVTAVSKMESKSNCVFFLLGSGPYEVHLRKLIQKLNVSDRVVIHPKVPYSKVPEYIAMSNTAIIPLPDLKIWKNQSPLKLFEYLALDKPIIATKIPAHTSIPSKSIYFIKNLDEEIIANAILHMKNHQKAFQHSNKTLIEKYSWENIAKALRSFLNDI